MVRADDLILISVDDHLVEPPDMFEGRLPARFQDRAPRVVHQDDGSDVWTFNGAVIPNIGLNAVAGRPREEYGIEPTAFDEMRHKAESLRRTYSSSTRLIIAFCKRRRSASI